MSGRKVARLAGWVLGGLMLCGVAMRANADLVVNGGFETGDFTGWTTSIDPTFDGVDTAAPHDGNFAAFFGNVSGISTISQTLATAAGTLYHIEFWLQSEADVTGVSALSRSPPEVVPTRRSSPTRTIRSSSRPIPRRRRWRSASATRPHSGISTRWRSTPFPSPVRSRWSVSPAR